MIPLRKRDFYFKGFLLFGILLLTFSFVHNRIQNSSDSVGKAVEILTDWIQEQNAKAEKIAQKPELLSVLDSLPKLYSYLNEEAKGEAFYLFVLNTERQMIYWSTSRVTITNTAAAYDSQEKLVRINNGYYVIKSFGLTQGYQLISLLPVYQYYPVENKFLKSGYSLNSPILQKTIITRRDGAELSDSAPVLSGDGKEMFYIKENILSERIYIWPVILLELLGVFLVFLFVNRKLESALKKKEKIQSVLWTAIYAIFIEVYINLLQIPSFTSVGNIFQSDSYASPFLADSLGGLLLRMHILHWIFRHWIRYFLHKTRAIHSFYASAFMTSYLVFSFYLTVYIIASLHRNSILSFDFNHFNLLSAESLFGILILNFSFALLYIPVDYLRKSFFNKKTFALQFFLHIVFIWVGYFFGIFESLSIVLILLFVFALYELFLIWSCREKLFFAKHRFLMSIVLLSIYAFLGAVSILYFSNLRKVEVSQHYAAELASERDYAEEFDLTAIVEELSEDNFVKSYFESPYLVSFDSDNRIKQKYFSKYMGVYNISIHSFNSQGLQLKGDDSHSLYTLQTAKNQKGAQIITPNLYYFSAKSKGEKYMIFTDYLQEETLLGHLVIVLTPKAFISYNVYPELLRSDAEYAIGNQISDVTYAIYRNGLLIRTEGNYSYPLNINSLPNFDEKTDVSRAGGYVHVAYSISGKRVVVSYKQVGVLGSFSYFSFILIFQIVFFYILSFVDDYRGFWFSDRRIRKNLKLNTFQKQIQGSMISLVLFSLVLVGAMTMFFFNVQYNHMHNESLKRRGHAIADVLEAVYTENLAEEAEDDLSNSLLDRIQEVSEIYTIDINTYDYSGKLMYTSQPEIFRNGLQSTQMSPRAYQTLRIEGFSNFIQNEWIGKLKFISAYLPLSDPDGEVLGFVNLPYYGKERNIKNDISFFLMSIVNIYTILILGAALLSVWVSRAIVKPLSIITESIKKVELGKKNVPIQWRNKDEIGELVSEYNRMVDVLEESAGLLAKSERESAWREMAKQVAHEIKNPLTPMKLSIQHLQRAIEEGREDVEKMAGKISVRLIEEIDTLANIATAFSNFAKMPTGKPEKIDIAEVVKSVAELFETNKEISVRKNLPDKNIYVFADREQMVRVFTNLLKNAIQSVPDDKEGHIEISINEERTHCVIQIKDNGVGIPKERFEDIFEPNFTTKSSGTGLGLAICKSIVESTDGEIWFENNTDVDGATFFVRLKKIN